ncbi:hypothetical protein [Plesiocystis pacifica]|uniref:hypothetical protein n=1 Tax=Plesiocystis pacifica TaxID=191768 RepID=UPI0012FAE578|nr:hypothetical protein [Plesiocystis pacifica]
MLTCALTFACTLSLEPPPAPPAGDGREQTSDGASAFVADMPDPHAESWDPPPGPKPPAPAPVARTSAPESRPASRPAPTPSPPLGDPTSPGGRGAGHGLRVAGSVFGGAGIVGLAVAAYLYQDYSRTQTSLAAEASFVDAGVGDPARLAELERQSAGQRRATIIAATAGGSSLLLGGISLISGTVAKQRAATPVTTWLAPGPGEIGLALEGRF